MKDTITQEAVTQYELLCPLLSGIYGELQELSKKKPDTPLNNFKVKSINRVLEPIKELLKEEKMCIRDRYRKDLRELTGYYKLLADAMDVVEAFLAKIGDERNQQFFAFLGNKVDRLYHEATGIAEYVLQIRDIHQSKISSQQNKVMQLLTIVTTIFMPLTLITGWYGMNFREMPELYFKYGYAAVIVISAVTVVIEIIFFKKKKWF